MPRQLHVSSSSGHVMRRTHCVKRRIKRESNKCRSNDLLKEQGTRSSCIDELLQCVTSAHMMRECNVLCAPGKASER